MSYIPNLRNQVIKTINLPIFNTNNVNLRKIRRINNIDNSDRAKIVFISNILKQLNDFGYIKEIQSNKTTKQYKRIKIIEK